MNAGVGDTLYPTPTSCRYHRIKKTGLRILALNAVRAYRLIGSYPFIHEQLKGRGIMTVDHNVGEREFRLPKSTRKHIRMLKQEGNLKEATRVWNAAIDQVKRLKK